jgi:hypothetical protein
MGSDNIPLMPWMDGRSTLPTALEAGRQTYLALRTTCSQFTIEAREDVRCTLWGVTLAGSCLVRVIVESRTWSVLTLLTKASQLLAQTTGKAPACYVCVPGYFPHPIRV